MLGKKRRIYIAIALVISILLMFAVQIFQNYTQEKLYEESVSQLEEVGLHLFEKLDIQLKQQWTYLETLKVVFEETGSVSEEELADILRHYERDLCPEGKTLLFRAIDEDGIYYTHEGKQGIWTGLDFLSDTYQQSFLIQNWLDNENYMAFTQLLLKPVKVDGKEITHLVILRSMTDMEEYFHITAYDNQNLSYIVDVNGVVLAESGELEGIDFEGSNVFNRLRERKFTHVKNFDEVLDAAYEGDTICTDVEIDGEHYYLMYNRMPEYVWGLLVIVSADSVAASTANMVSSLMSLYIIFTVLLIVVLFVIFFVIFRLRDTADKLGTAEAATIAKSQFLSNMSHDIRTPMNAIVGLSKLMEFSADDPSKTLYYVHKLQSSSQYMLGLINDILDMSKIEAGEVHLNREPVNVREQVEQIETIIGQQAEEKGQSFAISMIDLTHEHLIGDGIRIRQIFLNLLTNAVKYTQNGGSIKFEIQELPSDDSEKANFKVSVIDNGFGMSPEFVEHIFEAFTREESSLTNKIQGTGLGMCITKSIVDLMGGTITVESELGKGSTFEVTFSLPIDAEAMALAAQTADAESAEAAEKQADEKSKNEKHEVHSALAGRRFLCAEDNELNAEILQAMLGMHDASCTIYPNGQEIVDAFADVKPGDYDAILMDVQMPIMNGMDATRAIRSSQNPLGGSIPIIAMTANAFDSDVRDCLAAGMDLHIAKPIDITALERAMIELCGNSHSGGAAAQGAETS